MIASRKSENQETFISSGGVATSVIVSRQLKLMLFLTGTDFWVTTVRWYSQSSLRVTTVHQSIMQWSGSSLTTLLVLQSLHTAKLFILDRSRPP
jgi:hypothetical protein